MRKIVLRATLRNVDYWNFNKYFIKCEFMILIIIYVIVIFMNLVVLIEANENY